MDVPGVVTLLVCFVTGLSSFIYTLGRLGFPCQNKEPILTVSGSQMLQDEDRRNVHYRLKHFLK